MEKKIHSANNDCHLGTTRRKSTPSSCQTPLQKPPCFLKSFTFCYGPKLSETVCATGVLSIIPGSSWRPAFNKERQCLMKSALQLKYTQKKIHTRHMSTEEMSWPFERGVGRHIHIPILWNCPRKKNKSRKSSRWWQMVPLWTDLMWNHRKLRQSCSL